MLLFSSSEEDCNGCPQGNVVLADVGCQWGVVADGTNTWEVITTWLMLIQVTSSSIERSFAQLPHIDCSQQGNLTARRARSLHIVHRSLTGISGSGMEL